MSATLRVEDFTENQRLFRITPPIIKVSSVILQLYMKKFYNLEAWPRGYKSFYFITGGNVVRGNRTVMQMNSLRDHPDMSYGSNKQ